MSPDRENELREDYDVCMSEEWTAKRFLIEALNAIATLRTERDAALAEVEGLKDRGCDHCKAFEAWRKRHGL